MINQEIKIHSAAQPFSQLETRAIKFGNTQVEFDELCPCHPPSAIRYLPVWLLWLVWRIDITYVQLEVEDLYLAVLMDVFTRAIRGWHLSRSVDHALTLSALRRALQSHTPTIHHSDQGMQYAATDYGALLRQHHIAPSMAARGKASQNGYAERVIRTIKEEEVQLSDYRDYADALARLGHFLDEVYTHKRIHSALGYLMPAEYEQQWRAQQQNKCSAIQ